MDPRKKGMIGSDQTFDAISRKFGHSVPQIVSLQQVNIYQSLVVTKLVADHDFCKTRTPKEAC